MYFYQYYLEILTYRFCFFYRFRKYQFQSVSHFQNNFKFEAREEGQGVPYLVLSRWLESRKHKHNADGIEVTVISFATQA